MCPDGTVGRAGPVSSRRGGRLPIVAVVARPVEVARPPVVRRTVEAPPENIPNRNGAVSRNELRSAGPWILECFKWHTNSQQVCLQLVLKSPLL